MQRKEKRERRGMDHYRMLAFRGFREHLFCHPRCLHETDGAQHPDHEFPKAALSGRSKADVALGE